jgi:NitT/TauT family transport system permease protein
MNRTYRFGVSLVGLLVAWVGLSVFSPRLFPPPWAVAALAVDLTLYGDVGGRSALYHVGITFGRVLLATTIALVLAVVIGIAMRVNDNVASVFETWLPIWMTPPDVVVILIFMVLMGFNTTAIVTSVSFVCTPFALVSIWEGMQDLDPNLVEMAATFDADRQQMWRSVYLPHLMSYVFASLRNLFGMTWKVAVIGEVFGITNGVGARIRYWFLQSNIEEVVAYAAMFTVVVLLIEYAVLKPLEQRAFAWRA